MSFIYALTDNRWSSALVNYQSIWMDINNGSGGTGVGLAASSFLKLSNNGTDVFNVFLSGKTAIGSTADVFSSGYQVTAPGPHYVAIDSAALGTGNGAQYLALKSVIATAADQRLGIFLAGCRNTGTAVTASAAGIQIFSAEAWTIGVAQGAYLRLATTPTGSPTRVDRWQVVHDGHFTPVADNTYDLGAQTLNRVRNIWLGADIFTGSVTYLHRTLTTLTNNAAAGAGTLLNAPTAGNPTKWVAIDDNGTNRYFPTWT